MAQKPYKRRFTFVEGKSNKFWEIEVVDVVAITRWGRIGTAGQAMTETYGTNLAAVETAIKKCNDKLRKGYKEDTVPLTARSQRPRTGEAIASEAVSLFLQSNPQAAKSMEKAKQKASARPKKSASTDTSKPSKPSSENTDQLTKPKRRVKI